MPIDLRRLPVPDNSQPPCVFAKCTPTSNILTETKDRNDGRLFNQHRPIFVNVGVVTRARGSAYIEMGQTKVVCAVYGPREAKTRDAFSVHGQLTCELKCASFSSNIRGQHQQTAKDKEASRLVKEALAPAIQLDKYPKLMIEVFAMVLEDGGSSLAAAISCASLALCDGGIEMFDVVVGLSMRRYGDVTLIDLSRQEESNVGVLEFEEEDIEEDSNMDVDTPRQQKVASSDAKKVVCKDAVNVVAPDCKLTIGYLPSLDQISMTSQNGHVDITSSQLFLKEAVDACRQVDDVLKQWLLTTARHRLKQKTSAATSCSAESASQNIIRPGCASTTPLCASATPL